MWFRQWMLSEPKLFKPYRRHYRCSNIQHMDVQSFYMAEQACLMSRGAYASIAVSVAMLISILTLVSLLFPLPLAHPPGAYDVFVSYASEDLQWVREHLMPELEERLGD
nr:hypothetical protein BaRGS_033709 [Batillaria attramentaria]